MVKGVEQIFFAILPCYFAALIVEFIEYAYYICSWQHQQLCGCGHPHGCHVGSSRSFVLAAMSLPQAVSYEDGDGVLVHKRAGRARIYEHCADGVTSSVAVCCQCHVRPKLMCARLAVCPCTCHLVPAVLFIYVNVGAILLGQDERGWVLPRRGNLCECVWCRGAQCPEVVTARGQRYGGSRSIWNLHQLSRQVCCTILPKLV